MQASFELLAQPDAVAVARRALAEAFLKQQFGEETERDLLLVLSELVTNAVVHGSRPGDLITIDVAASRGTIDLAVTDAARGGAPRSLSGDLEATGGRGLLVVERLADEWTDTIKNGRRVVRCRLTARA